MSEIAVILYGYTADALARFLTINACNKREEPYLGQPVRCAIGRQLSDQGTYRWRLIFCVGVF